MANNARLLELALKGLEVERDRIDQEIADIQQRLNGSEIEGAQHTSGQAKRGGLTAAGRKRLSDLMKKRWASRRRVAKK